MCQRQIFVHTDQLQQKIVFVWCHCSMESKCKNEDGRSSVTVYKCTNLFGVNSNKIMEKSNQLALNSISIFNLKVRQAWEID